jgi:prephenate dehydrogenase
MYPRTVKVRSSSGTVNEYVRVVEAHPMFGVARRNPLRRKGRIFD